MKIRPYHVIAIFLFMLLAHHLLVLPLGLYESNRVWIDKPFHIVAGIVEAMLGLLLFRRRLQNIGVLLKWITIINFALLGSFIWELFEFAVSTWFNTFSLRFEFYSFGVEDALLDMLFGMLGGTVIAFFATRRRINLY